MLQSITIKRLFNQFDYKIDFKPEGITILTGPNGYGKTTILKIIYSLISKNIVSLFNFPFLKIELTINNKQIIIQKDNINDDCFFINDEKTKYSISYIKSAISLHKTQSNKEKLIKQIIQDHSFFQDDFGLNEYNLFEENFSNLIELDSSIIDEIVKYKIDKNPKAYFIKEQRLIHTTINENHTFENKQIEKVVAIKKNANALATQMLAYQRKSDDIGRDNDSNYVTRLLSTKNSITEEDFTLRYSQINNIKKNLSVFGLYSVDRENPATFNPDDAKALAIFLDDTEKKLTVFEDLLRRLQLFSKIIERRGFTQKKLTIHPVFGYKFLDSFNKEIDLDNLSSGEQHELILIYELIFNASENTIVLIDEPEISLHVVWQKEFIHDLEDIIKLNKITVIVATHSPQIINGNWDLAIDLFEQNNNTK